MQLKLLLKFYKCYYLSGVGSSGNWSRQAKQLFHRYIHTRRHSRLTEYEMREQIEKAESSLFAMESDDLDIEVFQHACVNEITFCDLNSADGTTGEVIEIMLDLTMYQYMPLVNAAFALLVDLFSTRARAFKLSRERVQILSNAEGPGVVMDLSISVRRWVSQLLLVTEGIEAFDIFLTASESSGHISDGRIRRRSSSNPASHQKEQKSNGDNDNKETFGVNTWSKFTILMTSYGLFDEEALGDMRRLLLKYSKHPRAKEVMLLHPFVQIEYLRNRQYPPSAFMNLLHEFICCRFTQLEMACFHTSVVHTASKDSKLTYDILDAKATIECLQRIQDEGDKILSSDAQSMVCNLGGARVAEKFLKLRRRHQSDDDHDENQCFNHLAHEVKIM